MEIFSPNIVILLVFIRKQYPTSNADKSLNIIHNCISIYIYIYNALKYNPLIKNKCEAGPGINSYYQQLYASPTKVAVLGNGCSVGCIPVGLVSRMWNLTQVYIIYI